MENRKLIVFCDIDGTLVDCTRGLYEITDETAYALKEIKKKAYLILVTGRPKCFITERILECQPDGFIMSNGTIAVMNDEIIHHSPIDIKDFIEVKNYCENTDDIWMVLNQQYCYCKDPTNQNCIDFVKSMNADPNKVLKKYEGLDEVDFIWLQSFTEDGRVNLEKNFSEKFNLNRQQKTTFDCVSLGTSKGNTIKKFLDSIDLDYEKIICFGDGLNDIGMMEIVDYAFAMGNAQEKTKQAANEVIDDVLNNGLYKALVDMSLISPIK